MTLKKTIFTISTALISILILIAVITSHFNFGTYPPPHSSPAEYSKLSYVCNEVTKHILSSDGISCNFSIRNPETYLGQKRPDTLGTFDTYTFAKENAFFENMLLKLSDIRTSSLSEKDKLTYNALYESLTLSLALGAYPLFSEPLSPISGIHTQLPILLGEYHFYDTGYINTYFNILHSVPEYFNRIIEFEKYKASNNMFMSEELADTVIERCREFIAKPVYNHLITSFDEKIKQFHTEPNSSAADFLTAEQLKAHSITNKNIVLNEIIPAYESLISAIESLKTHCTPAKGLCLVSPPDKTASGKDYYAALFRSRTCSDIPPDKAFSLFKKTLESCKNNISQIDLSKIQNTTSLTTENPSDIVATLKQKMLTSYPDLKLNSFLEIKPVPESLENSLSPAMYLTPPIDDFNNDCIYINNASCDPESLYTTLAHEAFPGHMYQIRYFGSLNPEPVRLLLNFPGYAEGWATYAEIDMTDSIGYDTSTATLLKNNKLAVLCIYSLIDIGIHYYGWELFDTIKFLNENGFDDTHIAKELYTDIVYEPVIYPQYTLGCIEFMNMKKYAQKKQDKNFNPADFHRLILETGPIWFDDLWKIIKDKY